MKHHGTAATDTVRFPLRIRSRLRERRPRSVRRHTGRTTTRFLVLLTGDALALLVYQGVTNILHRMVVGSPLGDALIANPSDSAYFAAALFFCLFITGSYSRHRALNRSIRLFSAAALASAFVLAVLSVSAGWTPALAVYAVTVLLTWGVLLGERRVTDWFLRAVWPRDRGAAAALIVRTGDPDDLQIEAALLAPGGDYRVVGRVEANAARRPADSGGDHLGSIDELGDIIERHHIEAVVVCGPLPEPLISDLVEESLLAGAQVLYPARNVRIPNVRPTLIWHYDQPFFELGAPVLKATALIAKRITDILGATVALLVASPICFLVAIAVRLDSHGPVFFTQDRAGLGGRRFRMLKFRTMRADADLDKALLAHLNHTGDPRLFKIPRDPRITRLGHFLRRWSIDELPQFVNVLRGDMSLVGPRPFFESDFEHYEDHHFRRLDAKPGITGLWQVSGGSAVVNFEDVVFLDRQYIEQWSYWLDVSIMFRTLPAILRRTEIY
ncbi:MAG: sugar transferase [Gemmatimonadota bacterium]|nr:sugar transferase [Gemmatimonadota bacterium]